MLFRKFLHPERFENLTHLQYIFETLLKDTFHLVVNQAKESIVHQSRNPQADASKVWDFYCNVYVAAILLRKLGVPLEHSEYENLYLTDIPKFLTDQEKQIWNRP